MEKDAPPREIQLDRSAVDRSPSGQQHRDEDCPNIESLKKLKGEVKRLRQELIMNPKKKHHAQEDSDEHEGLDDDEKAALRMLSDEQRKIFIELEEAGANPKYLKRKLRQAL